jgi:hypothetical protein
MDHHTYREQCMYKCAPSLPELQIPNHPFRNIHTTKMSILTHSLSGAYPPPHRQPPLKQDLNVLSQTCKHFYTLLTPTLSKSHGSLAVYWACEHNSPTTVKICLAHTGTKHLNIPNSADPAYTSPPARRSDRHSALQRNINTTMS